MKATHTFLMAIVIFTSTVNCVIDEPTKTNSTCITVGKPQVDPLIHTCKTGPTTNPSISRRGFRAPQSPQEKTQEKAQEKVEFLLGRLKSFVHKTIFDSQAFMLSAKLLNHQLSEVATQVNSFHPPAEGLLELVRFAGHLFRSMRDATDSMVFFNKSGTKGRILVHRLIQLNLQILVMCEFREISESEVDGYTQKIVEIEQLLSSWSRTFRRLLAEPLSVHVMFRNELEQAKNMLKVLRRHATREGVFQS